MNKTFKKILSVCCTVVTTLTATLFRSTEVRADDTYKIVFIGYPEVGKTQLVGRIEGKEFSEFCLTTMSVEFSCGKTVNGEKYQVWDTAGMDLNRGSASS